MRRRVPRQCSTFAAVLVAVVFPALAAAAMQEGMRGDGVVDLYVGGRALILNTDGAAINGFILTSQAGMLAGEAYSASRGVFVTDEDALVADQLGYALDGLHDLGRVVGPGASFEQLRTDLTFTYTLVDQQGVYAATILPALPGDADLDGEVGRSDFLTLQENIGSAGAGWLDADFNFDGQVNAQDYLIWKLNVGNSVPGVVPEPATLLLAAVGGVVVLRRRRK